MIISHRHRFIFLKTRKTAGTSVELFLRQFCGPDDVITRDAVADERLAASLDLPVAQNHGEELVPPWRWRRRDLWWARRNRAWPRHFAFRSHQPASALVHLVDPEVWETYRKITVVRDPWEVAVSMYHWRRSNHRPGTTLDLSMDAAVERSGLNWRTYTIDDVPVVDHVVRHERLVDDLEQLCGTLGLVPTVPLPRAKATSRPPDQPAHRVLTLDQARRVAELAAPEIELFGYEWRGDEPL